MRKQIIAILVALLFITSYSADTSYNDPAVDRHAPGKWSYTWTIVIDSLASADIFFGQAVQLPGNPDTYSYFVVEATESGGTEDFNLWWVYLSDPTAAIANWKTGGTDSDVDAVTMTAVTDTLGIYQGTVQRYDKIYPYILPKIINGGTITGACTVIVTLGGNLNNGADYRDIKAPINTAVE